MMKIEATTDRKLVRAAARSDRYVRILVTAPDSLKRKERLGVNVAIVLDRSGSMGGEKIRLAKKAVRQALQLLDERDRFSVVVYDDVIEVVVESTKATDEGRKNALARIDEIEARGTTNLAEGWLRGAEQVALHQADEMINRCLLLTDGLANLGITDPAELERHAAELYKRGISTTTFGLGADFDEDLLQRMARAGGGNFYFIEQAEQIPDYLASELGEALEVVARDVSVVLETEEGLIIEPLTPVREKSRFDDTWVFGLGDLVAKQEVECVLRLNFPRSIEGSPSRVRVSVEVEGDRRTGAELEWTYADHGSNDVQARDRTVDRRVAEIFASLARQEALSLNRDGRYEEAADRLRKVTSRIRSYAGDDSVLNRIASTLEPEINDMLSVMEPMEGKLRFSMAHNLLNSRDEWGRARRPSR